MWRDKGAVDFDTIAVTFAPCKEDELRKPKISNLSFPLDGVPSPYESAIRFRAANEAGSDKISLHSYHLMYGPFLAPYLETNVVSINCPCFT